MLLTYLIVCKQQKGGNEMSVKSDYEDLLKSEDTFRYQLLSRMKGDCEYYLGYGNRSKNSLWADDETEQIEVMKELWKSFAEGEKPEWLSWDDILKYESQMVIVKE